MCNSVQVGVDYYVLNYGEKFVLGTEYTQVNPFSIAKTEQHDFCDSNNSTNFKHQ